MNSDSPETTAVIVAVPPVMDPVRLVGQTDKHATLLFFGETATLPYGAKEALLQTLSLTAKMFTPFSEEVGSVSRLGGDDPPALVANLSGFMLNKIRDTMLVDRRFAEYLKNATQHPQYTPHVTLDYPDYQGEAQLRELAKSLYKVRFDRLALWWGDEQIEFSLGFDSGTMDVAAHAADVEKFFAHVGKKGMKWGVRNADNVAAGSKNGLDTPKNNRNFQKFLSADKDSKNPDTPVHPQDTQYKSGETSSGRKFGDFVTSAAITGSQSYYRKFDTGEKAYDFSANGDTHFLDKNGKTTTLANLEAYKREVAHADEIEKFFAHVGVKGMHWGIRKQSDGSYKINPETGKVKVPAIRGKDGSLTPLSPKGGVASVDAVNRHVTETLIKAKGIDSLTNVEIKAFVDRLDLEKRYSKHLSDQPQKNSLVKKLIKSVADNEVQKLGQGKKGPVLKLIESQLEAKASGGKHKK